MKFNESHNSKTEYEKITFSKICPETDEKATITACIRKQKKCKTDLERTHQVIQGECSLLQGNIGKFYTCSKCLSLDDLIL